jgi:hypothetical protein
VNRLKSWSFVAFLEILSRFSIVAAAVALLLGGEGRRVDRDNRAWQTINTAQSQGGDGGRTLALNVLNRDRVSLAGLRAPNAYLSRIDLSDALLRGAVLDSTTLNRSSLCYANLWRANFTHADLSYADLSDAIAAGALFYEANLYSTNLAGGVLDSAYFGGATVDTGNVQAVDTGNVQAIVRAGWDTAGIKSFPRGALILAHRGDSARVLKRFLPWLSQGAGKTDSAFEVHFTSRPSLVGRLRGRRAKRTCSQS